MPLDIKDTIKDKADKLVSAIYLVTNFLNDLDQIKWKLRHKSLNLKDSLVFTKIAPAEKILSDIRDIISLIDIAVLDRQASVMNFSILRQGYLSLQTEFHNYISGDWYKDALIPAFSPASLQTKTFNPSHVKEAKLPIGSLASNSDRQEKIISFVNQHNWSSIKEVAKFIPGVSSKTIQRELAELVRAGQLKKMGERRWSRYAKA